MASNSTRIYDAVVIGGGHNGLTAAAYLSRSGLSTLVLERRAIVGGCCVTEEIAPGCRVSTTSYVASMLRPEVIQDLGLAAYGTALTIKYLVPSTPVGMLVGIGVGPGLLARELIELRVLPCPTPKMMYLAQNVEE